MSVAGADVRIEGAKTRSLLVYLALHRNTVVSTDRLVDELWERQPPQTAAGTLHAYVSRLRRALGEEAVALVTRKPGYQLNLRPDQVDAEQFTELHRRASSAAHDLDARGAHAAWQQALGLWQGQAPDSVTGFASAGVEADRLDELRRTAREGLMAAELLLGRHSAIVTDLGAMVQQHPGRERLWILLITALYRDGRQSEALAAYARARSYLRQEYGVEPGAELRDLQAAVLAHDPSLDPRLTAAAEPPGASPARWSLPSALLHRPRQPDLVGRVSPLRDLERWWSSLTPHRLMVLTGEPGVGKTRLAEETALAAHRAGALVLWGRSTDAGLAPYEAVVDALQDHLEILEPECRPVVTGRGGQLLARLLPQVRTDGHRDDPGVPLFDQHEMFEAVSALLRTLRGGREVLIVLEDLHWADGSTLQLVHHLARHPAPVRVLATCRLGAAAAGSRLAALLIELRRDGLADQLDLTGLAPSDVRQLLDGVSSTALPSTLALELGAGTGGNPFLLCQVARRLRDAPELVEHLTSRPEGIPEVLRTAVLAPVRRLGPAALEILEVGAIIGPEFEVDFLARVVEQSATAVAESMRAAALAGALKLVGPGSRRYGFAHALVQSALAQGVSAARRSLLHRRVSAVLQDDGEGPTSLAEIVRHLTNTAAPDASQAVDYAVRAAEEAVAVLGFGEADQHYRTALQLFSLLPDRDELRRCQLLLARGEAVLADYATIESRAVFREATWLAVGLGAEVELRRAVTGLIAGTEFGVVDAEAEAALTAATARPDRWGAATLALLRAGHARVLEAADPRTGDLVRDAEQSARSACDDAVTAFVLGTVLLVNWRPANLDWRCRTVDEALRLAGEAGMTELVMELLNLRAAMAAESGDLHRAAEDVAALTDQARRARRPFFVALGRMRQAASSLLAGDYHEADRLSAAMMASAGDSPNFAAAHLAHTFVGYWDRGRLAELLPSLQQAVHLTGRPEWEAALALAAFEAGQPESCRAVLDRHAASAFAEIPDDWLRLPTLCYLGESAVLLGQTDAASRLLELLRDFRDRQVLVAHGVLSMGAAARVSGALAALTGRVDEACADFELALGLNSAWGAWPWLVRTQLAYADVLDEASHPDRRSEPVELRRWAAARAASLGMVIRAGPTSRT